MTTAQQVARALQAKGPNRNGWWEAKCVYHEDLKPSLNFTEDGYHCFGCEADGPINKLAEDLGIRERKNFKTMKRDEYIPPSKLSAQEAMNALEVDRHLRVETIARFGIQADETRQAYVYTDPAWPEETQRFKSFNGASPRYSWDKYNKGEVGLGLYGLAQALSISSANNVQRVTLVEGEPDVWTMAQAGLAAVTFTGGATTVPDGAVEIMARNNITHVTVIYDLDKEGLEGRWKAAAALELKGMTVSVRGLPETLGAKADVSTLYADVGADDEAFKEAITNLEEAIRSSTPRLTVEDRTDVDNATRFVHLHGPRLHYIAKWRQWLAFFPEKHRWDLDHGDVHVRELAKDVGRNVHKDLPNIPHHLLDDAASLVKKCLNKHGITAMVDLARGEAGILLDHEELDANPWLLGVENGVVDLRTGELRPGAPEDLITLQCRVDYDPKADCPRFLQAMEEWQGDEEVRRYIQRLAGYALFGKQEEHIFVIHFGTGANGKSSFVKALQNVLGPYSVVPSLSLLINTGKTEHDTIKAALFRKRLAVASETKKRVSLDEAQIKTLTGDDRISARGMHQNPWEFDQSHTLWLCTNDLPEITGRDTGMWRRTKVVPWLKTFEGKTIDKQLGERLQAEAPGILRWMVQGFLDWQEHGLEEPDAVKRASLQYRDQEDVLRAFVNECGLMFKPELEIGAAELTEILAAWCKEEGRKAPKGVSEWLEENDCTKTQRRETTPEGKPARPRYWEGIGFRKE